MSSFVKFKIPKVPKDNSVILHFLGIFIIVWGQILGVTSNFEGFISNKTVLTVLGVILLLGGISNPDKDSEYSEKVFSFFGIESPQSDLEKGILEAAYDKIKSFIGGFLGAFYTVINSVSELYYSTGSSNKLKAITTALGFISLIVIWFWGFGLINEKNDSGILLLNPEIRKNLEFLLSLFFISAILLVLPSDILETIKEGWSHWLIIIFSTIGLLLTVNIYEANHKIEVKLFLLIIAALLTIAISISLFNLLSTLKSGEEYRILSLKDLKNSDRMSINNDLYETYRAVEYILNKKEDFFGDNDQFNIERIKDELPPSLKNYENRFKDLKQYPVSYFKNLQSVIDDELITIYTARKEWEINSKNYLNSTDKDKNNIIDKFFEDEYYKKLSDSQFEIIKSAFKDLRKDWINKKPNQELPDPEKTRKAFGNAVMIIGGNIALNALSGNILNEVSNTVKGPNLLILYRYMFVNLYPKFVDYLKFLNSRNTIELEQQIETYKSEKEKSRDREKTFKDTKSLKGKFLEFREIIREPGLNNLKPSIEYLLNNTELLKYFIDEKTLVYPNKDINKFTINFVDAVKTELINKQEIEQVDLNNFLAKVYKGTNYYNYIFTNSLMDYYDINNNITNDFINGNKNQYFIDKTIAKQYIDYYDDFPVILFFKYAKNRSQQSRTFFEHIKDDYFRDINSGFFKLNDNSIKDTLISDNVLNALGLRVLDDDIKDKIKELISIDKVKNFNLNDNILVDKKDDRLKELYDNIKNYFNAKNVLIKDAQTESENKLKIARRNVNAFNVVQNLIDRLNKSQKDLADAQAADDDAQAAADNAQAQNLINDLKAAQTAADIAKNNGLLGDISITENDLKAAQTAADNANAQNLINNLEAAQTAAANAQKAADDAQAAADDAQAQNLINDLEAAQNDFNKVQIINRNIQKFIDIITLFNGAYNFDTIKQIDNVKELFVNFKDYINQGEYDDIKNKINEFNGKLETILDDYNKYTNRFTKENLANLLNKLDDIDQETYRLSLWFASNNKENLAKNIINYNKHYDIYNDYVQTLVIKKDNIEFKAITVDENDDYIKNQFLDLFNQNLINKNLNSLKNTIFSDNEPGNLKNGIFGKDDNGNSLLNRIFYSFINDNLDDNRDIIQKLKDKYNSIDPQSLENIKAEAVKKTADIEYEKVTIENYLPYPLEFDPNNFDTDNVNDDKFKYNFDSNSEIKVKAADIDKYTKLIRNVKLNTKSLRKEEKDIIYRTTIYKSEYRYIFNNLENKLDNLTTYYKNIFEIYRNILITLLNNINPMENPEDIFVTKERQIMILNQGLSELDKVGEQPVLQKGFIKNTQYEGNLYAGQNSEILSKTISETKVKEDLAKLSLEQTKKSEEEARKKILEFERFYGQIYTTIVREIFISKGMDKPIGNFKYKLKFLTPLKQGVKILNTEFNKSVIYFYTSFLYYLITNVDDVDEAENIMSASILYLYLSVVKIKKNNFNKEDNVDRIAEIETSIDKANDYFDNLIGNGLSNFKTKVINQFKNEKFINNRENYQGFYYSLNVKLNNIINRFDWKKDKKPKSTANTVLELLYEFFTNENRLSNLVKNNIIENVLENIISTSIENYRKDKNFEADFKFDPYTSITNAFDTNVLTKDLVAVERNY